MTPRLRVVAPGMHTTIQDFGRFGFQAMGVPVSGALDPDSLRLANALVGNAGSTAGVEILYQGPRFEVLADSARVAVGGVGAAIEILGDGAATIGAWRGVTLPRGRVFRVDPGAGVSCCYLAVAGGFDLAPCLGSLSTYTRAGFGGYRGRTLRAGDELPLSRDSAPGQADQGLPRPPAFTAGPMRVLWGLQRDYFTEDSLNDFVSEPFVILAESDRMGYRIAGPGLVHRDGYDIVSDGISTGSIQVPGNGQPIILLADRQTTGGYPKIATVISADLPALGRRRPGDEIRFQAVGIEEAEQLRRDHEARLRALEASIAPLAASPELNLKALYENNLISGAVAEPSC